MAGYGYGYGAGYGSGYGCGYGSGSGDEDGYGKPSALIVCDQAKGSATFKGDVEMNKTKKTNDNRIIAKKTSTTF